MKAAIYNPYLDTLGGGERYTFAFAEALAKNGYAVDVQWSDEKIKDQLHLRFGINVDKINLISDIRRGDGYDLCFWVSDGSIPLLYSRKNILHFQTPFHNVDGKSLLNRMKMVRIDKVVCNSLFTKRVVDEEYGFARKSVVLHPPVDTKHFRPMRKENLIVYVGRFSELVQNKRQDVLISAFKKFSKLVDQNWKLILAGGVEVGMTEDYMVNLRANAAGFNIEIIESPSFQELASILGRARFFWSAAGYKVDEVKEPEKTEHFGITTVEAMAAGAIPIVYGAGGQKSVVEDGVSGFIWIKKRDLTKITQKLIGSGEVAQLSRNARERSKRYSYESFDKAVSDLLA